TLLKFFFGQMLDQLREDGAARVHPSLFHPEDRRKEVNPALFQFKSFLRRSCVIMLIFNGLEWPPEILAGQQCQNIFGVLRRLPPGHIKMQTVNNREIKFLRQRLEQIGGGVLNKHLNRLIEVSNKDKGGVGVDLCNSSAESSVCQSVWSSHFEPHRFQPDTRS